MTGEASLGLRVGTARGDVVRAAPLSGTGAATVALLIGRSSYILCGTRKGVATLGMEQIKCRDGKGQISRNVPFGDMALKARYPPTFLGGVLGNRSPDAASTAKLAPGCGCTSTGTCSTNEVKRSSICKSCDCNLSPAATVPCASSALCALLTAGAVLSSAGVLSNLNKDSGELVGGSVLLDKRIVRWLSKGLPPPDSPKLGGAT